MLRSLSQASRKFRWLDILSYACMLSRRAASDVPSRRSRASASCIRASSPWRSPFAPPGGERLARRVRIGVGHPRCPSPDGESRRARSRPPKMRACSKMIQPARCAAGTAGVVGQGPKAQQPDGGPLMRTSHYPASHRPAVLVGLAGFPSDPSGQLERDDPGPVSTTAPPGASSFSSTLSAFRTLPRGSSPLGFEPVRSCENHHATYEFQATPSR
jgi:hypothetical protein